MTSPPATPDAVPADAPAAVTPPGLERLSRVPLAMAIGMRIDAADAAAAHGSLPGGAAVALAGGTTIDPLAVLPFVDQLSSVPLAIAAGGQAAMSTIELAVAFAHRPGAGPLSGIARPALGSGAAQLVTAQVADPHGLVVATASAWFAIGKPPGGGADAPATVDRAIDARGPFQAMIALSPDGDDGATLAADRWEAIGWTGLPALHGGAVAAALARAGQRRVETLARDDLRLAGITVRYLRAAGATGATARATVDAIGRRTARLSATLAVAGETVATAQLLFVPD